MASLNSHFMRFSSVPSAIKNRGNTCCVKNALMSFVIVSSSSSRSCFTISADLKQSISKARFIAKRTETINVQQLERPLIEYMSLPASQYSVLDAERIERVDESTFRCYVTRIKFFAFEVCPVLLVRVEEQPNGCCIRLLSCKLEGSPMVVAQNEKFSASMVNQISCSSELINSAQQLTSDTVIEVAIEIPFAFQLVPVEVIESTGRQVLEQILRIMLPRFMAQLVKDYKAWATGDMSRQPLGTGEI
ncbi:putative RAP release 2, galactose-binding-like domain protein [Thalictrum thalictroides]|uniref:Putative RAP release 2, galactose-binding-like domain protein n=1 Tax=Thalictrum thalictroides TaxID=46969 RepID=A0A7J6W7Y8_THATH|nr:putative RAP release 2, galactose-binding-like domain protein [Thalictrum thalictroides]